MYKLQSVSWECLALSRFVRTRNFCKCFGTRDMMISILAGRDALLCVVCEKLEQAKVWNETISRRSCLSWESRGSWNGLGDYFSLKSRNSCTQTDHKHAKHIAFPRSQQHAEGERRRPIGGARNSSFFYFYLWDNKFKSSPYRHLRRPASRPANPAAMPPSMFSSDEDLPVRPFRFLGALTPEQLRPLKYVILISWVILAIAPRWRHTMAASLLPPMVLSVVHVAGIVSVMMEDHQSEETKLDFTNLHGVAKLFQEKNAVYLDRIHHVVFDLLVARTIIQDSIDRHATPWQHVLFVLPCLCLTFALGPSGWLVYTLLKNLILRPKNSIVLDDEMWQRSLNYHRPSKKFA